MTFSYIISQVGWLLLDLYTLYTISLKSSMMYIRQNGSRTVSDTAP